MVYHKIGLKEVLLEGLCMPIAIELTFYSIILIARIPFGRITNSIALGLYILTMIILVQLFQTEKNKEKESVNQ